MSNEQTSRRLWIVDGSYLLYAQRRIGYDYQFDYRKLRERIEKYGEVFQAFYLNATSNPPSDEQDSFHTWLKSAPPRGPKLQVKLYKLKDQNVTCPSCQQKFAKRTQKGVDVGIATLALTLIDRYDTLILSSGDGDFMDALEYIRNNRNKRVELAVFKYGVSTDLQSISDAILWLDDIKDEIRKTEDSL